MRNTVMPASIRPRCLLLLLVAVPTAMLYPQAAPVMLPDSVDLVPGAGYAAGGMHRWLFGDLWRNAWTTPLRVPVLDLRATAGGLTPLRRGGGFQTASLRFRGADGVEYKFRSLDKNPVAVLPRELRETFVASIVQDFIATAHPLAALPAGVIVEAAGVLHAPPTLCLLPDDSALGAFRPEFGGRAGLLEVHPSDGDDSAAGFAGADDVSSTQKLVERLRKDNDHRVHTATYLKARMLDLFMGDWDRHSDQWRWARFDSAGTRYWYPIPRNRDQAFARYNGVLPRIVAFLVPQIESCDPDYPRMQDLTWSGRHMDRRFLATADWVLYDSLLGTLLPLLDDALLEAAVYTLPPPLREEGACTLLPVLRTRRDGLRAAVRAWYEVLAREVDVHLSDKDDLVVATRHPDGTLTLEVRKRKRPEALLFSRHFHPDLTDEIRVYAGGGDDSLALRGEAPRSITLRFIAGGGGDAVADASLVAGGRPPTLSHGSDEGAITAVYDRKRAVLREATASTRWYADHETDSEAAGFEAAQRDWGEEWMPVAHALYNSDLGVLVGGGATYTRYGFRNAPYAARVRLVAGVAPMTANLDVGIAADFHPRHTTASFDVLARYSSFEVLNYFGRGNESAVRKDAGYSYLVKQNALRAGAALTLPIAEPLRMSIGAWLRYTGHDLDDEPLYLSIEQPFGYDRMLMTEVDAALRLDLRDNGVWPTRGVLLDLSARALPALYDQRDAALLLRGEARAWFSAEWPLASTLALRAAARRNNGETPFFEAAFLGGMESLRGFEKNRFAGDASLLGTAELRVPLGHATLLFPTEFGALAFVESGRVYVDHQRSDRWHASWGGGVWYAPVSRDYAVSATLARSVEGTRLDVTIGFAF